MKKMLLSLVIVFAAPAITFADGMADFNANCGSCHGGKPRTIVRRAAMMKVDPNKLLLQSSEMKKAEMIAIVEKGKGMMPAFENKLTKEQVTAIIDYVMDMRKKK